MADDYHSLNHPNHKDNKSNNKNNKEYNEKDLVRLEDGDLQQQEEIERQTIAIAKDPAGYEILFKSVFSLLGKEDITDKDIWRSGPEDTVTASTERFEQEWIKELKKDDPKLIKALFRSIAWEFSQSFILYLIAMIFAWSQILVLPFMIDYIADSTVPWWYGLVFIGIVFTSSLITSFSNSRNFRMTFHLGIKVANILRHSLFKKALKLPKLSSTIIGTITNLVGSKHAIISMKVQQIQRCIGTFFQFFAATGVLYYYIGYFGFIPITTCLICTVISLSAIRFWIMFEQRKQKEAVTRIKLTKELFQGIQIVKYYAWEFPFFSRIINSRNTEVDHLVNLGITKSIVYFIIANTPLFGLAITFLLFGLYSDQPLTITITIIMLTITSQLKTEYLYLAEGLLFIAEMLFDCNTVQRILLLPSKVDYVQNVPTPGTGGSVTFKQANFKWDDVDPNTTQSSNDQTSNNNNNSNSSNTNVIDEDDYVQPLDSQKYTLTDINLHISEGEHVMIYGKVGSGKTSLGLSILGEIPQISGNITLKGNVAYVPQEAWIFNATVRENILFGSAYNVEKYRKVVESVALTRDFLEFPAGDLTEIGERGINLSGGQKQRVSIARALYADKEIYLLDDPLSAVDNHVSKHIFQEAIMKYLKGKTIIFICNQLHYLPFADRIILMSHGRIVGDGPYETLKKSNSNFSKLIEKFQVEQQQQPQQSKKTIDDEKESSLSRPESAKFIKEEDYAKGTIPPSIHWYYYKSGGIHIVFFILLLVIIGVTVQVGGTWWIALWAIKFTDYVIMRNNFTNYTNYLNMTGALNETLLEPYPKFDSAYWATSSAAWIFTYTICALIVVLLITVAHMMASARNLHRNLLKNLVQGRMSYFDRTPIGRILTRFTADLSTVDLDLSGNFAGTLNVIFQISSAIVGIAVGFWGLSIVTACFFVGLLIVHRVFVKVLIQVQKSEAQSRAPLLSYFASTTQGIETLRAFKHVQQSESRFEVLGEINAMRQAARYYIQSAAVFSIYLLCSMLVLCLYVGVVVLRNYFPSMLTSITAGIMLSYVVDASIVYSQLFFYLSITENNMNAIERIWMYQHIPKEDVLPDGDNNNNNNNYNNKKSINNNWITNGTIEFRDFSFKYSEGPIILHNLHFTVPGGSKVGIVGRTGAGKSSLLQGLYRIEEPASGSIIIDNNDIANITLFDLRSNLAIIPQNPILFSGTLRYNLDPFSEYSDDQIWNALELVQLKATVASNQDKLNQTCEVNGSNFSIGQRQLFCMARAILKKTKILLLDEATASVDVNTAFVIQETLKSVFKDCTVITIAHRIESVVDSDKILVLEKGKLVEYDSPKNLLQNTNGVFYSLVQATKLKTL